MGQPHIAEIIKTYNAIAFNEAINLRRNLGVCDDEKMILLALTDVSSRMGDSLGYNEYSTTKHVCCAVQKLSEFKCKLIVKLHPLQD